MLSPTITRGKPLSIKKGQKPEIIIDAWDFLFHKAFMDDIAKLLKRIRSVAKATGRRPSAIATRLFNDGKKYYQLCDGGDMTTRNYRKAMRELDRLEKQAQKK